MAGDVFRIGVDTTLLERRITRHLGDDLPRVVVKAINDTVRPAKDVFKAQIARRYDRPTRWTLNATNVQFANKAKPVGVIYFKDTARGGTAAGKYLKPTIRGTVRGHKGFERQFIKAGYMRASEYAVPGEKVRLNANGNVSLAAVRKIIAALKTTGATAADLKKGSSNRYFVARGDDHLARGVYQRLGINGRKVRAVFLFTTDRPDYKVELPFETIAAQLVRREFPKNLKRRAREGLKR